MLASRPDWHHYRCSASDDGGEKSTRGTLARISHLVQPLPRIRAMQLGAVLLGEAQVRQDIGLAVVDERAELRPFLPQLVGHVTQRLALLRAIRLDERLTQRGGSHRALLGFGHIRQRVAHPVYATALR